MRILQSLTEHDMVSAFLQAEINSSRYSNQILALLKRDGTDRATIDCPDTSNITDNNYRASLLGEYRGYGRNHDLFEGFPKNINWQRVLLGRDELLRVKYIDYDYWVELSGGTRLATDAARNILAGRTVFGVSNDSFLAAVTVLKNGTVFPEMILVYAGEDNPMVVLEGHFRLTVYALTPETLPLEISVIAGISPDIAHWNLY